MIALDDLLVCPRCHARVVRQGEGTARPLQHDSTGAHEDPTPHYACVRCDSKYPFVAGIPDFRLCRDPYITIEDDRAKALKVAAAPTFADALERYYAMTPEVPAGDAGRYAAHNRAGKERGEAVLERAASYGIRLDDPLLDAGCGSGGFVAAASLHGRDVVGADIALRWLVVARKRLAELAIDAPLVAACADHLPFADAAFGSVIAENLLEHVSAPDAVLAELHRVRRRGGGFMARCVNRFAPGPEPHVGLWGVGFLPRAVAEKYVRMRTGAMYAVRPPSIVSLRKVVRDSGGNELRVGAGRIVESDFSRRGAAERLFLRLYRQLERLRLPLLTPIAPYLDITSKAG